MRDKSILIYDQYEGSSNSALGTWRSLNMKKIREGKYNGTMSAGAKKRMTRAIVLLCESSQRQKVFNEFTKKNFMHQMSFITLTVADDTKNLNGREAYDKLLIHFLQWLRRTKKVTSYIWKAELQQRGQIHYHITTPTYISWLSIRTKWNILQKEAGLLDDFNKKFGHWNPNGTDVHEVRKIKDMASYLCKEIIKSCQNELVKFAKVPEKNVMNKKLISATIKKITTAYLTKLQGLNSKVWDCSTNLKTNKYFSLVSESMHEEFLMMAVNNEVCELYKGERFQIYKFAEKPHRFILNDEQMNKYNEHLQKIRRAPQQEITFSSKK